MSFDGEPNDMLSRIERLFNRAGLNCQITPDVVVSIWEKLAFNAVMNALASVLRATVGQLADSPETNHLVTRILDEVESVAAGQKVHIDKGRVQATIAMAFRDHRDHKPSMFQDVLREKKTEIDYINGAVVKLAAAAGVAAPVNETLTALVKSLEHSYLV
jgi:2-dehydropantoate 2-reductase